MPASICRAPSMRGRGWPTCRKPKPRAAVAASASMLCFSIRRWAWFMAASASCRLGLAARASSRAIRRSTGCGSAPARRRLRAARRREPAGRGIDPVLAADRLEAGAVRGLVVDCPAPRRRTGGRSRASTPRAPRPRADPAPAGGTATACAGLRATAPAAPLRPAAPAPAAAAGRRSGSG